MGLTYADYCWDGPSFRQRELTVTARYDPAYLRERYSAIDRNVRLLSIKRLRVLEAFSSRGRLLDFGCGTGRFVEAAKWHGWDASGCDVIDGPGRLPPEECADRGWDVVTFFDSLEHLPDPAGTVKALGAEAVMVSVPNCAMPTNEEWFMNTYKHRRPGEHLYHFSQDGLIGFFRQLGYQCVMISCFEDSYRPRYDERFPNILTGIFTCA